MKRALPILALFGTIFCALPLTSCHADENGTQNGYNMGFSDGFQGAGYNNPPEAPDDWKQGYHSGYFDGKDGLDGFKKGYTDASNGLPATSPVGSSKYFIRGCMEGYNAYHVEFKAGRMDGYKDGYNGLSIKDLSNNSLTYQKGYRSGYDYAIVHGLVGN